MLEDMFAGLFDIQIRNRLWRIAMPYSLDVFFFMSDLISSVIWMQVTRSR